MAHIVNLDQNAINSLLQAHNNFRSGRGLPALKWNSQIANQAAGWVGNSMKYENMMAQPNPHGQTQGVGQNIAWNFQSIPFPSSDSQLPYSGLVKLWNDETVPMQPGTYNHVSQVLWGSTTDVGCSVGVGPNPKTASNAAYNYNVILVCDYFPPGNVVGQQWNTVTTGKTPPNNPNPNPNTPKPVPATGKLVTMDQNAINSLLQAHNVFRAGKKMPPLKWNPNIANQAAQSLWADGILRISQQLLGHIIKPLRFFGDLPLKLDVLPTQNQ
ncbi:hypothetical protein HDU99_002598 [Rhizoclosmatium hyalinum]|nr:hypothetical protein HDU99_002598 [Rhizoclosmatium hyalinum]